MNYNRITLVGRLTADCEHKVLESGTNLCRFRMAVNDRISDKTLFIGATVFGAAAEKLNSKLLKGVSVLIDGRLEMDTIAGKDGKNRDFYGVIVDKLEINYADSDVLKTQVLAKT